jgi:cytoskeletal protein CcmA (bactofilin family)
MKVWLSLALAGAFAAVPLTTRADEVNLTFGGDQYTAGQTVSIEAVVERDAFIAGYDVAITAAVAGDAHLAGFNVRTSAPVTGDVYATGFSVSIDAAVAGDLTAMGNNVSVRQEAAVTGNARLLGQTVRVAAPVAGSALITAQTLTLESTIAGDLTFVGESITFAPGARVEGKFAIQAPRAIAVPAEVAAADRVTYTQLVNPDYMGEAGRTAENVVKGFWPAFWSIALWALFLIVLGAVLIALAPTAMRRIETASEKRPFRTIGFGILAFASTLGLLPVAALTIIGIVAIPFIIIYIVVACSVAYLAGAYLTGLRVIGAFAQIDTNLKRLTVLAVAVVAAVLLGLVPFVGWLISLLLVTFGFGTFAVITMARWSAGDTARIGATGASVGTASQGVA